MDLEKLSKQYRGAKYGQLVLKLHSAMNFSTSKEAALDLYRQLPKAAADKAEAWIDRYNRAGMKPDFWKEDCAEIFEMIIEDARDSFEAQLDTDDLFNLFQIINLNFVLSAHADKRFKTFIQDSIGLGILGKLFN